MITLLNRVHTAPSKTVSSKKIKPDSSKNKYRTGWSTKTTISVTVLVKFWTHEIFPKLCIKFWRNFWQYFSFFPELFPCPKIFCWEMTYTMFSDIFIFDNILKLQFLLKFWILWKNFGKIQSLGQNFRKTTWNIDKIFDAATLTTIIIAKAL